MYLIHTCLINFMILFKFVIKEGQMNVVCGVHANLFLEYLLHLSLEYLYCYKEWALLLFPYPTSPTWFSSSLCKIRTSLSCSFRGELNGSFFLNAFCCLCLLVGLCIWVAKLSSEGLVEVGNLAIFLSLVMFISIGMVVAVGCGGPRSAAGCSGRVCTTSASAAECRRRVLAAPGTTSRRDCHRPAPR